jgi:chemotaxis protein MotB
MASIKKKSSGGGGANWMDTYGDMVTLLLCFFVLLYSISSIDQQKWMIVVRSFNKDAVEIQTGADSTTDKSTPTGDDMPATDAVEQDLTELYEFLASYAAANQEAGDIVVSMGDGYVFISFSDAVFFDGDSTLLREDGKQMLDGIMPALNECAPSIDQLKVLGHTAQAGNTPNKAAGDRRIAGGRAAAVAAYIQDGTIDNLDPARIVDEGHGQWLNVAPHDGTEENKVKNRRVELMITGLDMENELGDSIEQYRTIYQTE